MIHHGPNAFFHHNSEWAKDDGGYLWICKTGACMYFKNVYGSDSDSDSCPISSDSSDDESGRVAAVHSLKAEQKKDRSVRSLVVAGKDSEEKDLDCLLRDASFFWEHMNSQLTELDPEMSKLAVFRPRCSCNLLANLAVCSNSGNLFWYCSGKSCVFLEFVEELPQNIDDWSGYIGVITPLGRAEIDRYTTLAYLMTRFSTCFRKQWLIDVQNRGADAPFPTGSFQVKPHEEYSAFISYRGATGRMNLGLTLIGEMNFEPAFILTFLICPFIVAG